MATEDFEARPYQIDLYEKAVANNSIIYLPTGSGKTYIAVMLIDTMSKSIRIPYSQGGKRTIFLVNTVPLVKQQSDYITRHTSLTCRGYSGEAGVDFWTHGCWVKEFEENEVLVMTAQIFLDILNHGYMAIKQVNLLIFDECHRGVGDHVMRRIMKFFDGCPEPDQPRILGTSATLLNSNIKIDKVPEIVHDLEITFHAKIITVDSMDPVIGYGKSTEIAIVYNPPGNIDPHISKILNFTSKFLAQVELKELGRNEESSRRFWPKPKTQKLKALIDDVIDHIHTLYLYGGSLTVMLHMLKIEQFKKNTDDIETLLVLTFLFTRLIELRKTMADQMEMELNLTQFERLQKYSSDKVIKLLEILRNYYEKGKTLMERKFCTIVFVQRRLSAKVLYLILKNAASYNERYAFIKPDYVVGFSTNPYKSTCEDMCIRKWNDEALMRFRNGVCNCLIATDVIDEGVDIPFCSLVVRYDLPNDFRAYVQSKGRARSSNSHYVMMINASNESKEKAQHSFYQSTESALRHYLISKTESRLLPGAEEIQASLYATEIKPYEVVDDNGVKCTISDSDAISLLHRYCGSLTTSKFVLTVPTIKLIEHEKYSQNQQYQISIKLSMSSPLREEIFGDIMPTIILAKRSAALKTCIRLHQFGELNSRLLPRETKEFVEDINRLMANWRDEDVEKKHLIGTYAHCRSHQLVYPENLTDAFPQAGKTCYLHIINAVPSYQKPFEEKRHREQVFFDLLNDPASFAILTNKKMSEIPGFPIFMDVGTLKVNIKTNQSMIILSTIQIDQLKNFHWVVFEKVLRIIKPFIAWRNDLHTENQFLIVPVDKQWAIDWDVVSNNQDMTEIEYSAGGRSCDADTASSLSVMSYNQSTPCNHNCDDWELVRPNYRETFYIVTKVCYNMNPYSTFPTDDFLHYSHYYAAKHQKQIKEPNQPLLEVKAISLNLDYTKPRGKSASAKRRERDNLEEHLIPELCCKVTFPRLYWLKAMQLPSVLHRLSQLLIADDLRKKIAIGTGLGVINVDQGIWQPLEISENKQGSTNKSDTLEEREDLDITDDIEVDASPQMDNHADIFNFIDTAEEPKSTLEMDILSLESNVYDWPKEKEPIDLERNIESIQLIDIEYYHRFSNIHSINTEILKEKYEKCRFVKRTSDIPAPILNIINHNEISKEALLIGPSPVDILYAITSKGAHDAFNAERLATLGDSYLKYIVSAFLFERYPFYTEGRLTACKGQIVGNRHLFYCGESIQLPGLIKIEYFEPKSNFLPPCFGVPKNFQSEIKMLNKVPNVIYEIIISADERKHGELFINKATSEAALKKISSWSDNNILNHTGTEYYLGHQIVKDKIVSDSVEALIGVYLNTMGTRAATQFIKWLKIIPNEVNIVDILSGKPNSAAIGTGDPNYHMPWAMTIENILGYQFQDRSFLLQAFTHPSYSSNLITNDYQRLEFLGDTIIDFLITGCIYEMCGELTPGELTDLRSALVNNITFACLTVKYGLHTGLLAFSPNLTAAIGKFVRFQEERQFKVGDDLHWILLEEEECCMAEYVEVPKVLGDLFESIIGAIYLDSNKNLNKVWEILYSLMHEEIHNFSQNIPKDPVRLIYETQGAHPEFKKADIIENTNTVMVPMQITIGGKRKLFHGFGATKKQAKRAASKQGLKFLHRNLQT